MDNGIITPEVVALSDRVAEFLRNPKPEETEAFHDYLRQSEDGLFLLRSHEIAGTPIDVEAAAGFGVHHFAKECGVSFSIGPFPFTIHDDIDDDDDLSDLDGDEGRTF